MVRGCPIPGEFVFFHWSITIESRHPSGSMGGRYLLKVTSSFSIGFKLSHDNLLINQRVDWRMR